jgi:hypothetical protein
MRNVKFGLGVFINLVILVIIIFGVIYGAIIWFSILNALTEGDKTEILSPLTKLDLYGAVCLILSVVILKSKIGKFLSINFYGFKGYDSK